MSISDVNPTYSKDISSENLLDDISSENLLAVDNVTDVLYDDVRQDGNLTSEGSFPENATDADLTQGHPNTGS